MTFEEAVAIAKGREWKEQRMTQLGVSIQDLAPPMRHLEVNVMSVPISTTPPVVQAVPMEAPTAPVARVNDDIRQDLNQVVDMMKTLSINLMNQGGGQRGHGQGYNSYNQGEDNRSGGGGYGRGHRPIPTCYNCGELGHKSPNCPKPRHMGGDMYPLPLHIPNRANDYGIDLRDEAGPSRLSAKEKGKTKFFNIVTVEKKERETDVMPLGKLTPEEQEGTNSPGPSKKKGKEKEDDDAKAKKKRWPRRKFKVTDLLLGVGQPSYSLQEDMVGRKADITFGQLPGVSTKDETPLESNG